jgi:hypothetical protein
MRVRPARGVSTHQLRRRRQLRVVATAPCYGLQSKPKQLLMRAGRGRHRHGIHVASAQGGWATPGMPARLAGVNEVRTEAHSCETVPATLRARAWRG